MSKDYRFLVTIRRVNKDEPDASDLTLAANSLTLDADGSLSIRGEAGQISVSAGLWDGFEVRLRSSDLASGEVHRD